MGSCCSDGKKITTTFKVPESKAEPEHEPIQDVVVTEYKPDYEPERKKSVPLIRKPTTEERFNKAGFSEKNPLDLIEGYQNEPIVSLEEALEHFNDMIDQIKEAKAECYYPSDHNLTHDESAAIYLYSMRDENSVYDHLEKAWSFCERSQMEPWFKYLKLLKSALNKIPSVETEIWQVIAFNENLENILRADPLQLYTCMGTCLPSSKEVKDHHDKISDSKTISVGYDSVDGKDVTAYTKQNVKDVIIWPGVKLNKAKDVNVDFYGSLNVHLKRVPPKPKETPSVPPKPKETPSVPPKPKETPPVSSVPEETLPVLPEPKKTPQVSPEPKKAPPVSPDTEETSSVSSESEETLSISPEPLHDIVKSPAKHFICPMKACHNNDCSFITSICSCKHFDSYFDYTKYVK